eukprot:scaffold3515_cov126-Cylindrotheca_fusiformis.AAC.18
MQLQKKGEALLGWASGSLPASEDKNDVIILKNHEDFAPDDSDGDMSSDEDDYWLDDDLQA